MFILLLKISNFFSQIFYDDVNIFLFAFFVIIFEFLIITSKIFVAPYFFDESVFFLLLWSLSLTIFFEMDDTTVHIIKIGKFNLNKKKSYIKFIEGKFMNFLIQVSAFLRGNSKDIKTVIVTNHNDKPVGIVHLRNFFNFLERIFNQ